MIQKKIEQNKRKATTKDVLIIQLSDEQKQKIHEEMDSVIVRSNWKLRYHKKDEEVFDSIERKNIYSKLSKLQKVYYNSEDWIHAMNTIMEAISFSLDHDYPWMDHEQAVEMWNQGKINWTFCPIPQLWTSWTTSVTDPETLKGIMRGDITLETSGDRISKAKERRHTTERVGMDYEYAVIDTGDFDQMKTAHMAGYDTPVSPIIKAMRGTFNRFSLPENNYFFTSTDHNGNQIQPPIEFDWTREGAGKEYFRIVNGKKDTSDDIVDFISEQNGHNLGPHFRSSIAPFLDSMSKTPEQNMTTGYNALDYAFSPTDMERCNENELKLEKAIMDQMVVIG